MSGYGGRWLLAVALCLTANPLMAEVSGWALFPVAGGLMASHGDKPDEAFMPFGSKEPGVRKSAEKLWGEPVETGTMEECGAGPIDFAEFGNGMMLHFQEGAFEGWFLRDGGSAETFEGIGIGTSIGAIRSILPEDIEVEETTLGYEFWATDLFGVVTGPDGSDKVEALWSGTACLFR